MNIDANLKLYEDFCFIQSIILLDKFSIYICSSNEPE